MALLPENTVLGTLRLVEVYAEQDFPIAFACQSLTGLTYVATWATEEANTTGWLYVSVSPFRLGEIRTKRVSLRDVFLKPEKTVYVVSVPKREGVATVEVVDPASLSDRELPTTDSLVGSSEIIDDLAAESLLQSADDAELSITGGPVSGNDVSIGFFGALLRMIQDLANAYGQAVLAEPTERAPVGRRVEALSRILVPPAFAPGSFSLRLKLSPPPHNVAPMFPDDADDVPILEFISQVLANDTQSPDVAFYANLPRVRAHLFRVLNLVSKQRANLKFRTKGNPFGLELTESAARERMASFTSIDVQTLTVIGRLPGGSTDTGRFELLIKGHKYAGRTTEESRRQLPGIPLDSRVRGRVRNRITTRLENGSVSVESTLLSISVTNQAEDSVSRESDVNTDRLSTPSMS